MILVPKVGRISKKYHRRLHENNKKNKIRKNFSILGNSLLKHLNGYKITCQNHVQLFSGVGISGNNHNMQLPKKTNKATKNKSPNQIA